jgi:Tfp pilus assembly protein PilF
LSYMAINDFKAAAGDLDEAVQLEPQNVKAWVSRGLAYERMGEKEKAAGSYAKALNIKQDYDQAKQGFARVGGKFGQTYQAFD